MKTILSIFSILLLISCQADYKNDQTSNKGENFQRVKHAGMTDNFQKDNTKVEPQNQPPASLPVSLKETPTNPAPRHIIKNADLRLQVENVDKSTETITALTEKHNGYLANMDLTSNNEEISNKITIKVPAINFEPFLNDLSKESIFTYSKKINTQDVTEEYVDLQSRLKTKKEVKEKYAEILRSKTKTLDEVYNAEEMIRKLQEEIEAAEGRLRYLANQSALSTILVDIYQPKEYAVEPVVYTESFWLKLWEGFENGWSSVTAIILLVVNIWPIIFMAIFIFWKRKTIINRFNKSQPVENI
ncbi:MAG: DUF4349 domain-containing protein [Saprospiraceae bacterium]